LLKNWNRSAREKFNDPGMVQFGGRGSVLLECAMSERNVIATTVFIAGIMLGAFTVQLKDQVSLRLGTLGFNQIMQCAATGP
jgi:hypothetical protein